MSRFSTRIGNHWLVLTHLHDSTWRLQVWGDTPLEAEVTAVDEAEAKSSAIEATIERLNVQTLQPPTTWNAVITRSWDSREPV
jgi:hypothetical protein